MWRLGRCLHRMVGEKAASTEEGHRIDLYQASEVRLAERKNLHSSSVLYKDLDILLLNEDAVAPARAT